MYVLSLVVDGMRLVRGFHFDRAAASVLTACLAVLDGRYLFLGSRLGNSLLLQFTEKAIGEYLVLFFGLAHHHCLRLKLNAKFICFGASPPFNFRSYLCFGIKKTRQFVSTFRPHVQRQH